MIFTNDKKHGGSFKAEFISKVKGAHKVTIAVGYFGVPLVKELESKLITVARRGECKILLGMVFRGGMSERQREYLFQLDDKLRAKSSASGIYISRKDYHGKLYQIDENLYLGSSNFSAEGFSARWECTAKITDPSTCDSSRNFINSLFAQKSTIEMRNVDLRPRDILHREMKLKPLNLYKVEGLPKNEVIGEVDIKLRVDSQPASSLNLYFDKGRKNQRGLYAPRPWYEVELTTTAKERESEFYPKSKLKKNSKKSRTGEFTAYIEDDDNIYRIHMKVASDGGKAIMSAKDSGGRSTLGRIIKGKLEREKILRFGERITSEMLKDYKRDFIRFKKISSDTYILEF